MNRACGETLLPACLAAGREPSDGDPVGPGERPKLRCSRGPGRWALTESQDGDVALCEEGLRPLCGGARPILHVSLSSKEFGSRLDHAVGGSTEILLAQTHFQLSEVARTLLPCALPILQ